MKWTKKEKRRIGLLGATTYASGAALFVFSRFVRVTSTFGEQHHWVEPKIRILHSLLTYLIILAVGYLIPRHILPNLKKKERRRFVSGVLILGVVGVLLTSALILLYAGEVEWVSTVALVHALVGLGTPILILSHALTTAPVKKR